VFEVREKMLEGSIEVFFNQLSQQILHIQTKHEGHVCKKEDSNVTNADEESGKII
jgi:hypothetical protein